MGTFFLVIATSWPGKPQSKKKMESRMVLCNMKANRREKVEEKTEYG